MLLYYAPFKCNPGLKWKLASTSEKDPSIDIYSTFTHVIIFYALIFSSVNLLVFRCVISCAVNQPSITASSSSSSSCSSSHLGPAHADDAVHVAVGVVEEGHADGVLAGRQPVAFGGRVNLEHVGLGAEERLFPVRAGPSKQALGWCISLVAFVVIYMYWCHGNKQNHAYV